MIMYNSIYNAFPSLVLPISLAITSLNFMCSRRLKHTNYLQKLLTSAAVTNVFPLQQLLT